MTALEVILLVCGVLCVALSFIISGKNDETVKVEKIDPELTNQQKEELRKQIDDIVKNELDNINERTEASLDKISNTKILEMNEYAETIMGEINRNHNETVFLYDMLNEKAKEIKNTVKDVNIAKCQVEKIQSEVTLTAEDKEETAVDAATVEEKQKNTVRDDAKERLAELVRQSNEKAKKQNPSMTKGHQANTLNNLVADSEADAGLKEEKSTLSEDKKDSEKEKSEQMSEDKVKKTTKRKATAKTASAENKEKNTEKAEQQNNPDQITTESAKEVNKSSSKAKTAEISNEDKEAAKPAKENEKQSEAETVTEAVTENDNKKRNIQFEKGTINNEKILELFQSGMTNKDIAKNLNLGIGEVKLVIDLYNSEHNN